MRKLILLVMILIWTNTALIADEPPISPPSSSKPAPAPSSGSSPGSLLGSSDTILFTGSFTNVIPLEVPPGTHGLQPQLALGYSSSSGNGWCGVGWDLSFGIIQRSTKNGIPEYDTADTFVFSSGGSTQELTQSGINEYHAKIDSSFMKFVFASDTNEWTAYDKSGTRYIFGQGWGESARLVKPNTNPPDVFSWSLSSIIDTDGNEIHFFYTQNQNQIYPEHIEYNYRSNESMPRRKIVFALEDRPDTSSNYRAGFAITTAKRLKSIETSINGSQVKKYELSYNQSSDIGRSLLAAVKTTKGTESLPATSFSYQEAAAPWLVSPSLWTNAGTDNSFYFYDFNGDGKVDLANNISGNAGLNVYFSSGNGFSPSPANPWLPSTVSGDFSFADFTGDGLIDVACRSSLPPYYSFFAVYRNTGSGMEILGTVSSFLESSNLHFGDFNGDGKTDWAIEIPSGWPIPSGLEIHMAKSDGTGFSDPIIWPVSSGEGEYFLFDFNGDGKTDIARRITQNGEEKTGLHVWFTNEAGTGFIDKGEWLSNSISTYKLYFFDVNGDGMLDVTQFSYKSDHKLNVYLNKGTGTGLDYQGSYLLNDSTKDIFLGDFNGDGLFDVAMNNTENDPGYGGLLVWLNTGNGFMSKGAWTNAGTGPRRFQLFDFNGDGKTDVAWYHSEEGSGAGGLDVMLANGSIPNLLSLVTNSLGGETSVTYNPSTEYTNRFLPFPIHVVSQRMDNSNVSSGGASAYCTAISYKDGYYDLKAKEFLGFKEVTVIDGEGNKSISKFMQEEGQTVETNSEGNTYVNPLKGKIFEQVSYSSSSIVTPLSKTVSEYSVSDAKNPGAVTATTRWYFPYLNKVRSTTYDNNVEKTTGNDYEYDGYGNVTVKIDVGDTTTNDDNIINVIEYEHRTALDNKYIVNLPKWQEVRDVTSTGKAKTVFTYDDNGNLTAKESGLDTEPNKPKVKIEYDTYGNVIKVEDAIYNADNSKGNVNTTTYDTVYHTFPVEVANILDYTKKSTYDPGTGNVLTETDANGQTTTYEYDTFGRVLTIYSPIDLTGAPSTIYEYDDVSFPRRITVQTKEAGQTAYESSTATYLTSYQFIDGLGRAAQTQSQNTTKWSYHVINDVKTYNSRGLMDKSYTSFFPDHQTYPEWIAGQFYSNSPTVPYYATTRYTYDALGRVIRQDLSDGTFSTVSFSGWTETTTDPKGKSLVYQKDAYGRNIQITEHINGQDYLTKYTYDTLGNLKTITNSINEMTTINYDTLGRKISMDDPKMGHWEYSYDTNGSLISQKDAKNQTTTLAYDRLSRIINKVYPSGGGQITYEYDTGQYGKGKLAKVTYPDGYKQFTYDKIGRVISSEEGIKDGTNTKVYVTGSTYNASGQQTKLTYPNSKEISYTYNVSGDLLTVGDSVTDFVKQIQYNQNKQILRMDFDNEVTTGYEYNPLNLRLTKLITGTGNVGFTDPTYISYDRKDHTAFREFLNKLEGVSK